MTKSKLTQVTIQSESQSSALLHGKTPEQCLAEMSLSPIVANAQTAQRFAKGMFSDLVSYEDAMTAMIIKANRVMKGDLTDCETTLAVQAASLDAIYNALSRKAFANLNGNLQAAETCLRLALKAQGQCRATLQTLAEIKNPRPVAFVKQANIAQGHQQINNSEPGSEPARTRKTRTQSSKRTIGDGNHGPRLDTRKTRPASGIDPQLETLGTVDRAEDV